MGLFDDLRHAAGDVGDVAMGGLRPVGRAVRRTTLDPLQGWNRREVRPRAFIWQLAAQHPEMFWDDKAFNHWVGKEGVNPNAFGTNPTGRRLRMLPFGGYLAAGTVGSDVHRSDADLAAMDKSLKKIPGWERFGLEFAADPMMYFGVGEVAKAGKLAYSTKTLAGAPMSEALLAMSKTVGKEAVELTGIPSVIRSPRTIARAANDRFLKGPLLKIINEAEAVRSLQVDKLRGLSIAEEARLHDKAQTLRITLNDEISKPLPNRGLVRSLYDELKNTQETLTGEALTKADIRGAVRQNNLTDVFRNLTPATDEAARAGIYKMPTVNRGEELYRKSWAPNRLWDWVDRTVPAKMERQAMEAAKAAGVPYEPSTEAVRLAQVEAYGTISQRAEATSLIRGQLQRQQREVFNIDYTTGKIDGFGDKDFNSLMRYGDSRLSPLQRQYREAFVESIQREGTHIRKMYEQSDLPKTKWPEWVQKLGTKEADGSYFLPRVERFRAEGKLTAADFPKAWKGRKLARITGAAPEGFAPGRTTKKMFGAKQTVEFSRTEGIKNIVYSHDAGDIYGAYADELITAAAEDIVARPTLERMGLTPAQLSGPLFQAKKAQVRGGLRTTQLARGLVSRIRKDKDASQAMLSAIRGTIRSKYTPDYVKESLVPLEEVVSLYVARSPELGKAAERLAGETARTLRTGQLPEKALAAGAEARATAQGQKSASEVLATAASSIEKEMDAALARANGELKDINASQEGIVKDAAWDQQRSQLRDLPGLSNRYFKDDMKAEIEKAFAQGEPGAAQQTFVGAGAAMQTLQAGLDASWGFIQSLAAAPSNPVGWAKSLGLGFIAGFHENIYADYLIGLNKAIDPESGKSILQLLSEGNVNLSRAQLFAPSEALTAMGATKGNIKRAVHFLDSFPLNRSWVFGRNIGEIEAFRAQVTIEQRILGRALTTGELQAVGRQAALATGVVDEQLLGIRRDQMTTERVLGRFGVQWFRSQTGRLVQALNGGQLEGRVARRLLMQQMGVMSILYTAASYGLGGHPPRFDPRKYGDFLTVDVAGQKMGFATPYRGMMQAMAHTIAALTEDDVGPLQRMRNGTLPGLRFWYNGAPTIGKILADNIQVVLGVERQNQLGLEPITPESIYEDPMIAANLITPMSAQAPREAEKMGLSPAQAAQGYAGGFLGLNVNPEFPTEVYKDLAERRAQELGFKKWDDVPEAQQAEAIRGDAKLQDAHDRRNAWLSRHPNKSDFVFDQIGKDKEAMEITLGPLWERVQAGEVTKPQWRDVYGNAAGNHAMLTDSLMDTLPEKERREPKTHQDQLAREYQAIQPEQFTGGVSPDTLPEPERNKAWDEWRTARQDFWKRNPEAEHFREYITQEYPARNWQDPNTRTAVLEKLSAQDAYDRFLQIPKYQGMSVEDGQFFDQAKSMMFSLRDQSGITGKQGTTLAYAQAIQLLQEHGGITPGEQKALSLAFVAMLKPKIGRALISGRRSQFLQANPLVSEWYPASVKDAGLKDEEAAMLGIQAPLGMSATQRAEQLAS